jgi:hypothetical protein
MSTLRESELALQKVCATHEVEVKALRTQLSAADSRIAALEKALKTERESSADAAEKVAKAAESRSALALASKVQAQLKTVSFERMFTALHATLDKRNSELEDMAIQDVRDQQSQWALEHEKLDTAFLLWAVESHEAESFWALTLCVGMYTISVPGGSALVAPDGGSLRRRHLTTFDLPAGTVLRTPPPGSAKGVSKMLKGTGGGITVMSPMDGVELYVPERSLVTFLGDEPGWVEVPGTTRFELPATWLMNEDGYQVLYEVHVPLGACIICPDEDNDPDGDGVAPPGSHDAFVSIYHGHFSNEGDNDDGRAEHFYVDATMTGTGKTRSARTSWQGKQTTGAGEEPPPSPKPSARLHRRLRTEASARRAAMTAAQMQGSKQAGMACVALMLPPRTRVTSTAGALNHLLVPSGCLFHFQGSSSSTGCFLPPGAEVTLPLSPAKSHTVMLSCGTTAVLPLVQNDTEDIDAVADEVASVAVQASAGTIVMVPGGAHVLISTPGQVMVPPGTSVSDVAMEARRVQNSKLDGNMPVEEGETVVLPTMDALAAAPEAIAARMVDIGPRAASLAICAMEVPLAAATLASFASKAESVGKDGAQAVFEMVRFARLAGLASILGKMPPEHAAAVLLAMDDSRAGAVLGHMTTTPTFDEVSALMPPKVAAQSTLWLKAWDAVQADDEEAQDTVLDIIEDMHPKVACQLLCRAPAQRTASYLAQFAERDPAVAAEILTWMGSLTTNISRLSERYLEHDLRRAHLLREVAAAAEDTALLDSSKALMAQLADAYGVRCTFMRLNCEWDSHMHWPDPDAVNHDPRGLQWIKSLSLKATDGMSESSGDDEDDEDEEDLPAEAAATAAIAATAAANAETLDVCIGVASEDLSVEAKAEIEAEDKLNLLHTTETIHLRKGNLQPSDKPRTFVDASVLVRAHRAALRTRASTAFEGIFVVPVLNSHGVPVAMVSAFDAEFSCDACDCGPPRWFNHAKVVQSLKLFAVAVGLATTATARTACELRRQTRRFQLSSVVKTSSIFGKLSQYTILLHGFQHERRKIGLTLMEKQETVRNALGEIKRYRVPPGIVGNIIVSLLVSVGDADVIAEVSRHHIDVIRWRGHAKRNETSQSGNSVAKDTYDAAWEKLWFVARRQIQLQYQHPDFILRRMQVTSRDVTSTKNLFAKGGGGSTSTIVLDSLRALLDGVTKKKAQKASDVATIIFKWSSAHLATLEMMQSIEATEQQDRESGQLTTTNPQP